MPEIGAALFVERLMLFFDTHCHLTDEKFAGEQADVISRAAAAGVTRMVTIASDAADAGEALKLARRDGVWSTAGVHPHVAERASVDDYRRIRDLLTETKVVAVGETGLDYYYDNSPRPVQRANLDRHFDLAAEMSMPIVLHSRDAQEDTMAAIRAAGGVVGVLHCFSGNAALLDAGLEAGWYISLAGPVSFRKYDGGDLVRAIPSDRLLIETDSPYLAPVPHRGRRNEPAYVAGVATAVATLRGVSVEEIAQSTTANALRFYGLPEDASQLQSEPG